MIHSRQDFDNIRSHAAPETSTSSTSHTSQSQSERADEGGRSNHQADSSYDWQPRDEREERQRAPSRLERPAPDDQTITQRGRSRSREDRSPRQRQRGERSNRDTAQPPEGVTSPREQELQRLRSAESQGGDQPERGISISEQRSVGNERGASSQDRGEHSLGSNRRRRSSYDNSESVTPNETNHCQQRQGRPDTSTGTSSRYRDIPEHHDRAPPKPSDVPPAM